MPKLPTAAKPATPAKGGVRGRPTESALPLPPGRLKLDEVRAIKVNGVPIPFERTKLTAAMMKEMLGWETEEQYRERCKREGDEAAAKAGYGETYLLKDEYGHKVRCWKNINRPFTRDHAEGIAQDILNLHYRFNGESIIRSESYNTHSGQHRGIGLILAVQKWEKLLKDFEGADPESWHDWLKNWPDGPPYIRSLTVEGISDDPEVVRTLDNVRPRSLGDIFCTMPAYQELSPKDRVKFANAVEACTELLWNRTHWGETGDSKLHSRDTNSAKLVFYNRHPRVMECVQTAFALNAKSALSAARVQSGFVAGVMYLMATSATDLDSTRYLEDRREDHLSWERWEKAQEFWTAFSKRAEDEALQPVAEALGRLVEDEEKEARGSLMQKKLIVLAKAWNLYLEGGEMTADEIMPVYAENANGERQIAEWPEFGGIDQGEKRKREVDPEATQESISEGKAQVDDERETNQAHELIASLEQGLKTGKVSETRDVKEALEGAKKKVGKVPPQSAVPAKPSVLPATAKGKVKGKK